MAYRKTLIITSIILVVLVVLEAVYSGFAIACHYCCTVITTESPLLTFINIAYFHNPTFCGRNINIGNIIDTLPDQAFVRIEKEPSSVIRTLVINLLHLILSLFWLLSSVGVIASAYQIGPMRVPWILLTFALCLVDLIAAITYISDFPFTTTLQELMQFVGGTASGVGNVTVDTYWTSSTMAIIHMIRFIQNMLFNALLVALVLNARISTPPQRVRDMAHQQPSSPGDIELSNIIEEENKSPNRLDRTYTIASPRCNLNHSFVNRRELEGSPESAQNTLRLPSHHRTELDKKRAVNFPENLLSLPQRLEIMMAEHQKRLNQSVVDTAGRQSQSLASKFQSQHPNPSEEFVQMSDDVTDLSRRGRRSTVVELQGQLPWTYVKSPMRNNEPSNEDVPPLPLPDYATTTSNFRKSSVHRAAPSLGSLYKNLDEIKKRLPRKSPDVLY